MMNDIDAPASSVLVEDITCTFGQIRALDGLSLEIPRGVSFGLLGPNGAGKTTLIRVLVGLQKPHGGTALVLGHQPSPRIAQQIGYMPQLPALYNELSVTENIGFFAQVYGLKDRVQRTERVEEVVKLVNLWERRKELVMNLSGGMRQRVSLACALVHRPRLLFLDEPTVGLDPQLRATFWAYFRDLTGQGVTLVISSHTMDDAARCDRLAFLRAGKIIAQGTPAELRAATGDPGTDLEAAFLHFADRKEVSDVR
jgi:ABC-2 type transport system ATP-binding protein